MNYINNFYLKNHKQLKIKANQRLHLQVFLRKKRINPDKVFEKSNNHQDRSY